MIYRDNIFCVKAITLEKILPRQIKKLHILHWQKPQKLRTAEVTYPSLFPSFL